MVNVGGQTTFVSGVNAVVSLNGNSYVAVKTFQAKWGNKLEEEAVAGTDIPIVNTASYHGEIDMEIVYSTENTGANEQFGKLLVPSSGQISAISLVWTGKDTSGNTRTFTLTSTFYPQQTDWDLSGTSVVKAKVSGILGARPTIT